jgi:hypothetical protein
MPEGIAQLRAMPGGGLPSPTTLAKLDLLADAPVPRRFASLHASQPLTFQIIAEQQVTGSGVFTLCARS